MSKLYLCPANDSDAPLSCAVKVALLCCAVSGLCAFMSAHARAHLCVGPTNQQAQGEQSFGKEQKHHLYPTSGCLEFLILRMVGSSSKIRGLCHPWKRNVHVGTQRTPQPNNESTVEPFCNLDVQEICNSELGTSVAWLH